MILLTLEGAAGSIRSFHGLGADTQIPALDGAMFSEFLGNTPRDLDGNGQRGTMGQPGGIESEYLSLRVNERPAGEAGIGNRFRPDIFIEQATAESTRGPADRRDNAPGGLHALAVGAPEGKHQLTNFHAVRCF